MQEVFKSISAAIGNTPLLSCKRFGSQINAVASIYAKLEYFNPTGSIKDRAAFYMLRDAISSHKLKKDSVVIEPTSGNTGIGLAALCASIGIKCILTMPDTMTEERIKLLKRYGADVVLTPGELGIQGSVDKARELAEEMGNAYIPSQFDNPSNVKAHYETTGPELWRQTGGNIDVLVAGVGSGGTITGCARFLKEKNPDIKIIAVEPAESPLLSGGTPASHGIPGIGANFVPKIVDLAIIDEIIPVPSQVAVTAAKKFISAEGALIGISSGAALAAASKLAVNSDYAGKKIVCICPDGGDRYFSTGLFDN
ncbi:MAG: cysteine synthase A [Ruminococcaceae bacterium]|nr:cysteine synthase A [Oscillospiraceae bacterium]